MATNGTDSFPGKSTAFFGNGLSEDGTAGHFPIASGFMAPFSTTFTTMYCRASGSHTQTLTIIVVDSTNTQVGTGSCVIPVGAHVPASQPATVSITIVAGELYAFRISTSGGNLNSAVTLYVGVE